MSHEIDTMAFLGELPWHGLGVAVEPDLTPDEILQAAGLDWTVEKRPLTYNHKGETLPSETQALVRSTDGMELTQVSDRWKPIQNQDAFRLFDRFVKAGQMTMETAGSLRKGRLVWALARTKEEFQVFGDDTVRGYFLFSNPHEYGKVATFGGTSIRVVCANTHRVALRDGLDNKVVINHRTALDENRVHEELAALHNSLEEFREQATLLGGKEYTDETLEAYFKQVFPVAGVNPKKEVSLNAKRAMGLIDTQPGAEFAPNSFWAAYNASTYMMDHVIGASNDNRLDSVWFGPGRRKKQAALALALDYARAA